jgi:hypothetical protein
MSPASPNPIALKVGSVTQILDAAHMIYFLMMTIAMMVEITQWRTDAPMVFALDELWISVLRLVSSAEHQTHVRSQAPVTRIQGSAACQSLFQTGHATMVIPQLQMILALMGFV